MEENIIRNIRSYDQDIPDRYTGLAIFRDGHKVWYKNGKVHRENGPAKILAGGEKEWWLNGEWHREDGPAMIWLNAKIWCINGKYHREDGPAVECTDGTKAWWLNGKRYSEAAWKRELIRRGIIKNPSLSDVMDAI